MKKVSKNKVKINRGLLQFQPHFPTQCTQPIHKWTVIILLISVKHFHGSHNLGQCNYAKIIIIVRKRYSELLHGTQKFLRRPCVRSFSIDSKWLRDETSVDNIASNFTSRGRRDDAAAIVCSIGANYQRAGHGEARRRQKATALSEARGGRMDRRTYGRASGDRMSPVAGQQWMLHDAALVLEWDDNSHRVRQMSLSAASSAARLSPCMQ